MRALNTGGGGILGSGVFDLENTDGPEIVRDRELLGVDGVRVKVGGGALDDEACNEDDSEGAGAACEVGTGTGTGTGAGMDEGAGAGVVAAASFACRFVTLRVSDSIFELSFFFSLISL